MGRVRQKQEEEEGNFTVRAGGKAASYIISPNHLNHISLHFASYGSIGVIKVKGK